MDHDTVSHHALSSFWNWGRRDGMLRLPPCWMSRTWRSGLRAPTPMLTALTLTTPAAPGHRAPTPTPAAATAAAAEAQLPGTVSWGGGACSTPGFYTFALRHLKALVHRRQAANCWFW